jgi:hypothetical protein
MTFRHAKQFIRFEFLTTTKYVDSEMLNFGSTNNNQNAQSCFSCHVQSITKAK